MQCQLRLRPTNSDCHIVVLAGILDKLLQERDNQEESSTLTADVHFLCWSYDDGLVQSTEKEGSG